MPSFFSTLEPNGAASFTAGNAPTVTGGAPSAQAALSDNSQATSVQVTAWSTRKYPLANIPAFSTDDLVDYVQAYIDIHVASAGNSHISLWLSESGGQEYPSPYGNGPVGDTWLGNQQTFDGYRESTVKHITRPNGQHWDEASINALSARYEVWADHAGGAVDFRAFGVFAAVYGAPTVSVLTPSGAQGSGTLTCTWSFTGGGNGAESQTHYRVRVFSAAQVAVAGFNPQTSRNTFDTGVVASSSKKVTVSGLKDGSYTVYVWAAQTLRVSKQVHWNVVNASSTFTVDRSPNTPSLQLPADGARFDSGAGVTFKWNYSHPDPTVTQSAYALKRTINGGAPTWWTGSAWAGVETFVTSSATQVVFGSGQFPLGSTYTWTVAVKDADGDVSAYASPLTFLGDSPPAALVTAPAGTELKTSRPGVAWTYSDANGDPQELYEVCIYTEAQASDPLLAIGDDTPVWTSGKVASSAAGIQELSIDLDNNASYVCYVRVYSHGVWGAWSGSAFDMQLETAAKPTLTATYDAATSRTLLVAQAHDNLLSEHDSNFENLSLAAGQWSGLSASVALSGLVVLEGASALAVTASSASAGYALCGDGAATAPAVQPLEYYTAMAWVKASTSGHVCNAQVWIRWWDGAKVWLGAGTDTKSASVATSAATWQQLKVSGQAPANARYASIMIEFQAGLSGRIHYVDQAGLMFGNAVTAWSRGGYYSVATLTVEYSDDGQVWTPLRGGELLVPDVRQQVQVFDYETTPRVNRQYRARAVAEV